MSRPWMPLYVADYLADTAHLRAAESGAYIHLIMHYWRNGGLPDDDRQLALIARMNDEEWGRTRPLIEPLFKAGKWKHKRIECELAKTAQRIEAGRKGGKATQANAKQTTKQNESDPPSVPVVVSVDTTTQPSEEDSTKIDLKKDSDLEVTRARARPACRLPEDWKLSASAVVFARTLLTESQIETEAEKFRDHWRARAGPTSVKRDWDAAWRNWCRKAVEMSGARNGQYRQGGRNGHAITAAIDDHIARFERAARGDGEDRQDPARMVRSP